MKENNIVKKVALICIPVLVLIFGFAFSKSEWAYFVNIVLSLTEMGLIISTFNEKHNVLKYVLVTILCFVIFTWLIPAAYYSGAYQEQGRVQMGLFDLFNYPVTALSYFGYIALFALLVGGFYGIMYKIPAYRNFLDRVADAFSKRAFFTLTIMMILIAFVVSICGIQIALFFFFPLLISIILLMGYDKVTAAMVTVGASMIGMMGSTYAYSNTNIINSVLGLGITSELLSKIIVLVIGLILLIFNVKLYINKIGVVKEKKVADKKNMKKQDIKPVKASAKKAPAKKATGSAKKPASKGAKSSKATGKSTKGKKSSKGSRRDYKAAAKDDVVIIVKDVKDDVETFIPAETKEKRAIWPFIVSFAVLLVIMILAFISWSEVFNVTAFTKATESVSGFELFKFPLFGKLLGTVNAFGSWSIIDFVAVMCVFTLFICLIYKVNINDVFEGFIAGIKKALPIGALIILIYTCLVITTYHPFQLVFYKIILGSGAKMTVVKVFLMSISAIFAGFFNVEPLYAFQSVLPYLSSLDYSAKAYPLIGVIYQTLYGLTMLIAPTSVVLITILSYLNISIKKWFKAVWKLLLELLVVLLILFIILLVV